MELELQLRQASLKPYEILRKIAERYGFGLGVPRHNIFDNKISCSGLMFCEGLTFRSRCSLTEKEYYGSPAYFYRYRGPVLQDNEVVRVDYNAYVLENVVSCRGQMQRLMAIRDEDTPEWFPDKI